jgi:N-acetylmuramoyl-L-alanine amidase
LKICREVGSVITSPAMRLRTRLLAALVLLSLPAWAKKDAAEEAYGKARQKYWTLKADESRRKYRDNWLEVAHAFDDVAKRYPKSHRTADALFTAAQLYLDLSQISRVPEDLSAAVNDFQALISRYPANHLSDDAAYWLAKAQLDRLEDTDAARATLEHALALNPKGDQAPQLKALLATVPAPKHHSTAAVASKSTSSHPAEVAQAKDAAEAGAADGGSDALGRAFAKVAAMHTVPGGTPASDADEKATRTVEVIRPSVEVEAPSTVARSDSAPVKAPRKVQPKIAKARLKELQQADAGELTLAEQLGLKVRRVVIDAGHGGHDSGAIGPDGTQEKAIALAIAKRLSHELTAMGLEVVLTRDDDTFVRLEDRAKIANEAHGDLFISIHCNSAPSHSLRGIETYSLNISSDRYSIRLAARENSSSEKGMSDLQFILADVATRANTDESNRLASKVQHSLISHLSSHYKSVKDLGTKQALFYVLLGAKMPAILVETSFLSNPTEQKRLESATYQQRVAESIAAGVSQFLGDRRRLAKVD